MQEPPIKSERPLDRLDNLLLAILNDLGEEVRKRRDPEYLYTASSVAAFGAVVWGVASSPKPEHLVLCLLSPALVAGVGSLALASYIVRKILYDHYIYMKLRIFI